MHLPRPDIARAVLDILQHGPVLQKNLHRYPPLDWVYDAGAAVRELVRAGLVERERVGITYLLRLK